MTTTDQVPFLEATTSICPECIRSVPATILEAENRIWLRSDCPKHGSSQSLLSSDAVQYKRLRQYTPARMGTSGGCCGGDQTCEPGTSPVCVLLLEITLACNLRCPTCYADAQGHDFMSVDEVRQRLDKFFKTANALDLLMISGGEPTIHPAFARILEVALEYPIGRILINTNGLRLQQDRSIIDSVGLLRDRV